MSDATAHTCGNCEGIDPASCVNAPQSDATDLRDQLVEALRAAFRDAPKRPMLDGPPGRTEVAIGLPEFADAVMPVVQPVLDRAEYAEYQVGYLDHQLTGAIERFLGQAETITELFERVEQAEAAVQRVRALAEQYGSRTDTRRPFAPVVAASILAALDQEAT